MENESSIQLAQALIQFLAYFTPAFVVMVTVEWAVSFFRRKG